MLQDTCKYLHLYNLCRILAETKYILVYAEYIIKVHYKSKHPYFCSQTVQKSIKSSPSLNLFSTFRLYYCTHLTLSQTTNLDSSKLEEFADDNCKCDENGRKFSKQVENTVGKGEIARYEQFLLFQQCFQKSCAADT